MNYLRLPRTLYFAVQSRFHRDGTGAIRTDNGYGRYDAWLPYLAAVDRVVVIGRVSNAVRESGSLVEGPGIRVLAVPFFHGPADLLRRYIDVHRFLSAELTDVTALYGARVPNILGSIVQRRARKLGAIFVAQVVGDPEEVLRAGAMGVIGRRLAGLSKMILARQVKQADAVIYVTRRTLQAKYPPRRGAPVLVRSNVELAGATIASEPRDYVLRPVGQVARLVAAGSQEQRYKGHDTLIDAVAILVGQGHAVHATIVGGGRFHEELITKVRKQGLCDSVKLVGHLAGAGLVRESILKADLFVMPSLTEGLPRVLVEAMSTGILSIGSRVGGIPELLTEECLFQPRSSNQLADTILRMLSDPLEMNRLAERQLSQARLIAESYAGPRLLSDFLHTLSMQARF